ncbi:hypothetical protein ACFQQB_59985 [Nonomuraea rubra]|uniref:hypothetical protein n=1 Tax=Nonomuraea rubra TaxID=46180 RepID=UPI00360E80AC
MALVYSRKKGALGDGRPSGVMLAFSSSYSWVWLWLPLVVIVALLLPAASRWFDR